MPLDSVLVMVLPGVVVEEELEAVDQQADTLGHHTSSPKRMYTSSKSLSVSVI